MTTLKALTLAALLAAGTAGAAQSLPPLEENRRVQSEFLSAAIGDEIRKNCPSISARMFRVIGRAKDLENYALSLGYSTDEITAMRKDPANKARLKALRDAYLAQNGVVPGDAGSYCRLGRAEIEKNTLTGWLLHAR